MRLFLVALLALLASIASTEPASCYGGVPVTDGTLCPLPSSDAKATTNTDAGFSAGAPCSNPVQCFVDPCSVTPQTSASCKPVRCEASYCDGCTATWYDANNALTCTATPCDVSECGPQPAFAQVLCSDGKTTAGVGACENLGRGCGWTITECPPAPCPIPDCVVSCELGYKISDKGCQTCECQTAEVCPAVVCAEVDFASCSAAGGYLSNNGCCTTCVTPPVNCATVLCAQPDCPVPTAGQRVTIETPPGGCCPICNIIDCSAVTCAMPLCAADSIIWTPPNSCCPTCAPQPDCKEVACLMIACDPTVAGVAQVAFVPDGGCCPNCNPLPNCAVVDCAVPQCGPDQEIVVKFGQCCGQCVDKDYCSRVKCAEPDCPLGYQQKVAGACCSTCSYCRQELEKDGIVCTKDGQPVCSPTLSGPTCSVPMPAGEYTQACKEVAVSLNSAAWLDVSTNTACKYSTMTQLLAAVPVLAEHPENFNCQVVSKDSTSATLRFCVTVAKGDQSISADSAANQVEAGLVNAPGVSGAASLIVALGAIFLVALMLLV